MFKYKIGGFNMKKHLLTVTLALGIICITGCSENGSDMQTAAEIKGGVSIYEGDKRVIFNLSTLPYDMEYKEYTPQFSSCEMYQDKSDNFYTPYIVAKVKIDGIDDETLRWFDEDLYAYGTMYNEKNQLNNNELSKICVTDNSGYRYYVFSDSLLFSHDYRYDFSESSFNVGFLILQGEDYRALQFIYTGFSGSNVKDLKDAGEEVWRAIKQKQNPK
jgi:hypothetical protein